ncbi:hypothetical protein JCM10295v2_000258 [Rhodotorula toruloides]
MKQKTMANPFEAYLGTVVESSREDVVAEYVDKLIRPRCSRYSEHCKISAASRSRAGRTTSSATL